MELFNLHVHTDASPDCKENIENMCRAAVDAGLSGIAITDHFSGSLYLKYDSFNTTKASYQNAKQMAKKYEGSLTVLSGVELDEMFWNGEYIEKVISSFDFDVILASVHRVQGAKDTSYFSRIDFSSYTDAELYEYAGHYFNDVLKTVKSCDFDVLSHLTIISRYICGKYERHLDLSQYSDIIDEILKTLINRDKALEVNTSEIFNIGLMPHKDILARYLLLGGRKVAIGSDAHLKENIAKGLGAALDTLRDLGFCSYYYYKNRQPYEVKI